MLEKNDWESEDLENIHFKKYKIPVINKLKFKKYIVKNSNNLFSNKDRN